MNWTAAQKEAITYENKQNILVAAAAGSGKTAVLVERIIRKILDPTEPVSVDEILVLTFTNAAAREMKNKIAAAIEKKLKELDEHPERNKTSSGILEETLIFLFFAIFFGCIIYFMPTRP